MPATPQSEILSQIESAEFSGRLTLSPFDVDIDGRRLKATSESEVMFDQLRFNVAPSADGTIEVMLRSGTVSAAGLQASAGPLVIKDLQYDALTASASAEVSVARSLLNAALAVLFRPDTSLSGETPVVKALRVNSFHAKLRAEASVDLGRTTGADVKLHFPGGAKADLSDSEFQMAPGGVARPLSMRWAIEAPSVLVSAGSQTDLPFADVHLRLDLESWDAARATGELTTTFGRNALCGPLETLFNDAPIPHVAGGGSTASVNDDIRLRLDFGAMTLTVDLPRISVRRVSSSHKGHGFDVTASIDPVHAVIALDGQSEGQPFSTRLSLHSGVRMCVGQFTGKKRMAFVNVTIVKPYVIDPFDVAMTFDARLFLREKRLVARIERWRDPAGSLHVGAIGDGPNAWGDISPLNTPTINMHINYVGANVPVSNPLPGALNSLNGREVTLNLERRP